MIGRTLLLVGSFAGTVGAQEAAPPAEFFAEYCVRCHHDSRSSGGQNFERLGFALDGAADFDRWQTIVDVLNLGAMPPESARRRPDAAEVQQVVDWATQRLAEARDRLAASRAVRFRRLSNYEYQRTIRDLFGLELFNYDPTQVPERYGLPASERERGFDNVAGALVTSDFLLDSYLEAAAAVIERATDFSPPPRSLHLEHTFRLDGDNDLLLPPKPFRYLFEGVARKSGSFVGIPELREQALPASGRYRIRVRVSGHHRHSLPVFQSYPQHEMLRLGVYVSPRERVDDGAPDTRDALMAEFEVPADGEVHEFQCEIHVAKDSAPRFAWQNGGELKILHLANSRFDRAGEVARAEAELGRKLSSREGAALINRLVFTDLPTPHLRLHAVTLDGPLGDVEWPPAGHRVLYGTSSEDEVRRFGAEEFRERLLVLCEQTFRRPVTGAQIEGFVDYAVQQVEAGEPGLRALQLAAQAVLCDPEFLYRRIPPGPLDDHALASRLSYFLWSSLPDAPLRARAAAGELHDPEVLRAEAARMLDDPRSAAFAEHFPECWLHLFKLGEMPPDPAKFRAYYAEGLEEAMRRETLLFFDDVLRNNRSVHDLLDAPDTFVNAGLARLYGLEGVEGIRFRRVTLPDRRRGGLLGQASVLTVTANGVDTSPILRGVWVLRNLFGNEPPPPPPGIEPIPPDLRGTRTVKEQLDLHRSSETCASCHRRIDPLGMALENFDAIGGWRTHYEERAIVDQDGEVTEVVRAPVDPSYEMPDGTPFHDVVEFKALLEGEREAFDRCLVEKLLTYALGRRPTALDRPAVDALVDSLEAEGDGLRDLILRIVSSEIFAGR